MVNSFQHGLPYESEYRFVSAAVLAGAETIISGASSAVLRSPGRAKVLENSFNIRLNVDEKLLLLAV